MGDAMFPQTLNLPPHFPPGFGEGTPPTRQGLCANGKPYVTEPSTGQTVCLCQLNASGPLPLSVAHGLVPGPVNCTTTGPVGMHLPPFRSPRGPGAPEPYTSSSVSKDPLSTRSIPLGGPYTTAALAAYHPYLYAGYEVGGVRKAAVRETTGPLKAWLNEHRKNPYPTKAEKIMLAIITQMTLTQVSTWFANARRRLKKETRGNWEAGGDDISSISADDSSRIEERDGSSSGLADHYDDLSDVSVDNDNDDPTNEPTTSGQQLHLQDFSHSHSLFRMHPSVTPEASPSPKPEVPLNKDSEDRRRQNNAAVPKPRIWSISAIIGLDEAGDVGDGNEDKSDKTQSAGCTVSHSPHTTNTRNEAAGPRTTSTCVNVAVPYTASSYVTRVEPHTSNSYVNGKPTTSSCINGVVPRAPSPCSSLDNGSSRPAIVDLNSDSSSPLSVRDGERMSKTTTLHLSDISVLRPSMQSADSSEGEETSGVAVQNLVMAGVE